MNKRIRFTKTISQAVTYMDIPHTYATEGSLGTLTETTTEDGMQIVYSDEYPNAFVVFSDEYEVINET